MVVYATIHPCSKQDDFSCPFSCYFLLLVLEMGSLYTSDGGNYVHFPYFPSPTIWFNNDKVHSWQNGRRFCHIMVSCFPYMDNEIILLSMGPSYRVVSFYMENRCFFFILYYHLEMEIKTYPLHNSIQFVRFLLLCYVFFPIPLGKG